MSGDYKRHVPEPARPAAPEAAGRPKAGGRIEQPATKAKKPKEIGGPAGPEPTRYGDWEINGRCVDF